MSRNAEWRLEKITWVQNFSPKTNDPPSTQYRQYSFVLVFQPNTMEFKKGLDGIDSTSEDLVKTYMLSGSWSTPTIKHYNAGVEKLMTFAKEKGIDQSLLLPINPRILGEFVVWAGPDLIQGEASSGVTPIKSTTIRTYLSGIKAWHLFHNFEYPHQATPRVEAILKAAAKLELREEPKEKKNPVLISHLFNLLETLSDGKLENQVAYTVALVAFWGMARLGELLKTSAKADQVKVKDVIWGGKMEFLKIRIRGAKTAAVGEIQEIHCQKQPSLLDPVSAIQRLVEQTRANDDDPLFSYPCGDRRVTLTKARCQTIFEEVWSRRTNTKLTGHSFRVGGASLRWNLKYPLETIVKVGRWKSKAYKLYIREYSATELATTIRILEEIKL